MIHQGVPCINCGHGAGTHVEETDDEGLYEWCEFIYERGNGRVVSCACEAYELKQKQLI